MEGDENRNLTELRKACGELILEGMTRLLAYLRPKMLEKILETLKAENPDVDEDILELTGETLYDFYCLCYLFALEECLDKITRKDEEVENGI